MSQYLDTTALVKWYIAESDGLLDVLTMQDAHFDGALQILGDLPQVPLRTLDALHLAVARANKVTAIATADSIMSSVAKALKFETHIFH